jgi:hypothetical protein
MSFTGINPITKGAIGKGFQATVVWCTLRAFPRRSATSTAKEPINRRIPARPFRFMAITSHKACWIPD